MRRQKGATAVWFGYVEELDEKHLPGGHGHKVNAVGIEDGGGDALRVNAEDFFDEGAVDEVAADENGECD